MELTILHSLGTFFFFLGRFDFSTSTEDHKSEIVAGGCKQNFSTAALTPCNNTECYRRSTRSAARRVHDTFFCRKLQHFEWRLAEQRHFCT